MSNQEDFTTGGNLTDYEVHPLFAQPVFTIDELMNTDVPALREILGYPMGECDAFNYGDRSENTYILNNPEFHDLKQEIHKALQDYANNVLGYAGRFSITQSWISVKRPGYQHIAHAHANSIISGVYYFSNDDTAEGLTFCKQNVSGTYMMAPLANPNVKNQFTFSEVTLSVTNNMLCMFPSYLPHRVSQNTSKANRYSIAFNALPTYALGSEVDLTEAEYLRINTK